MKYLALITKAFDLLELLVGAVITIIEAIEKKQRDKKVDDAVKNPDRAQAAGQLDDIFKH